MEDRDRRIKYFSGIPYGVWNVVLFLAPFLVLIAYSFFQYRNYQLVADLTLKNYSALLSSSPFYTGIWNSLTLAGISTLVTIVVAFLAAYYIYTRIDKEIQKYFVVLLMLPLLINYVVRTYTWYAVLSEQGVLNWLLQQSGIISEASSFLFNTTAVSIGLIYTLLPQVSLLIYLGLITLDRKEILAARDLGVSEIKTVFNVVIPQIKLFMMMGVFFSFMISFGDYTSASILGGGNIYTYSSNIVDTLGINNLPKASALGVLFTIFVSSIAALLYLYVMKYEELSKTS